MGAYSARRAFLIPMKRNGHKNLSTAESSPERERSLLRKTLSDSSSQPSKGNGLPTGKLSYSVYGLSLPSYHDPYKCHGSRMRYIDVELQADVEFLTHSKTYHFQKGIASIPLDLAKMLFRLRQALPTQALKQVPSSKLGRH